MARLKPIFVNSFQKGSSENANIGFGAFVGVETYSKKGVAQLTKKSTKVSGSVVTDLVLYYASLSESNIFAQGDTGKVYKSTDSGSTWTDISPGVLGAGNGLVFFDNVLYAFRNGNIDYHKAPYDGSAWVQGWKTGLFTQGNCPFIYPNSRGFYFGNGYKLGILRQQTTGTAIDPATASTYFYDNAIFQLPSIYQINCLSFLPPNKLMLGTGPSGQGTDSQIADIISWDTISLNLFGAPLRLFSQAGASQGGVKQLINRNNILYAVTGGNHAVFETDGSTFNLVDDISLYTTGRTSATGAQSTSPIFLDQKPQGIAVMGNKLYTGVCTSILSTPNGYGYFPLGVWSIAFTEGTPVQCEFTISTGTIVSNDFRIGALYPLSQSQMLISWKDSSTYGIDKTEFTTFQNNADVVIMESEMMEIGTPLDPTTIPTIQLNLTRKLVAGQTLSVYYRTSFDQDYALLQTFTSTTDGSDTGYKVQKNPIGATKFVQFQIHMSTSSPNEAFTPELRTLVIG